MQPIRSTTSPDGQHWLRGDRRDGLLLVAYAAAIAAGVLLAALIAASLTALLPPGPGSALLAWFVLVGLVAAAPGLVQFALVRVVRARRESDGESRADGETVPAPRS